MVSSYTPTGYDHVPPCRVVTRLFGDLTPSLQLCPMSEEQQT